MRKALMLLCCLLLMNCAAADSLTWSVPEGLTAFLPGDTEEAAAAMGMEQADLDRAMAESGTLLLMLDPEGTLYQLTSGEASESVDFHVMGRKKVTIFAQTLSRTGGRDAAVLRLEHSGEQLSETKTRYCQWWILLTPRDAVWPRTLTMLTARRGLELTLYITAPSEEAEAAALENGERFAAGIALLEEPLE